MRRAAALGGIAGPLAFIGAWAALGAGADGYSPIDDPISRLAAVDASTRWAMTGGMLALAAGVGLFSRGLVDEHSAAAKAALVTAVASVGIAASPLDSPLGGNVHAAAAGLAYASLAAVPALVGREQLRRDPTRGRVSLAVAAVTAGSLLASVAIPSHTGLWQRLGLTAGHLWIVGTAARSLRAPQAGEAMSTGMTRSVRS